MRLRPNRLQRALVAVGTIVTFVAVVLLASSVAVFHPRTDAPARVDAIVVVAGLNDGRYAYAEKLAKQGVSDHILVSRPPSTGPRLGSVIDNFCADSPPRPRTSSFAVECYTPDFDTTEGEAAAASRVAHARGWSSLLVVTYWGHVSRVRLYFNQCFEGRVFVTDTPERAPVPRRHAFVYETGGYAKAIARPAC